ncbi:unnamed protein product [Toxocara canis]|uniref:Cytochrome P450 n=1 Tax=Toxocara canis TaxID=6265 RepID=A0A183U6A0_TOXCA|nr:unnamed protein product [Toxocara canis]
MFLRRRRYPPGPRPLPLIGNFHQIDLAYPHRTMMQWKNEYGSIFTVWLPKPIIVLADFDVLKEALIKQGYNCDRLPYHAQLDCYFELSY